MALVAVLVSTASGVPAARNQQRSAPQGMSYGDVRDDSKQPVANLPLVVGQATVTTDAQGYRLTMP